MKTLLLIVFSHLCAYTTFSQEVYLGLLGGRSTTTSNFENRYGGKFSAALILGYGSNKDGVGLMSELGYLTAGSRIDELDENLNFGLIQLAVGPQYKVNKFRVYASPTLSYITPRDIRIERPFFNYDFDVFDFGLHAGASYELFNISSSTILLAVRYNKSLDGIIDDNFWQDDDLRNAIIHVGLLVILE